MSVLVEINGQIVSVPSLEVESVDLKKIEKLLKSLIEQQEKTNELLKLILS